MLEAVDLSQGTRGPMGCSMLIVALATVFGLCIGSFVNVVVARVPGGRSLVRPGSACPGCEEPIAARDNVPVLSWLWLRGRCRSCGERIDVRYPLVELATALLFGVTAARLPHDIALVGFMVAVAGLLALSLIDIEHRRLPTAVVWITLALAGGAFAVGAVVDHRGEDLRRAGVGAAIGFLSLYLIYRAVPRAMGFGDVRLATLCGLLLGWMGLSFVPIGLYGAFVVGAVVGVVAIVCGRAGRRAQIPFGPFLASATILAVWFGSPLAEALRDRV